MKARAETAMIVSASVGAAGGVRPAAGVVDRWLASTVTRPPDGTPGLARGQRPWSQVVPVQDHGRTVGLATHAVRWFEHGTRTRAPGWPFVTGYDPGRRVPIAPTVVPPCDRRDETSADPRPERQRLVGVPRQEICRTCGVPTPGRSRTQTP